MILTDLTGSVPIGYMIHIHFIAFMTIFYTLSTLTLVTVFMVMTAMSQIHVTANMFVAAGYL